MPRRPAGRLWSRRLPLIALLSPALRIARGVARAGSIRCRRAVGHCATRPTATACASAATRPAPRHRRAGTRPDLLDARRRRLALRPRGARRDARHPVGAATIACRPEGRDQLWPHARRAARAAASDIGAHDGRRLGWRLPRTATAPRSGGANGRRGTLGGPLRRPRATGAERWRGRSGSISGLVCAAGSGTWVQELTGARVFALNGRSRRTILRSLGDLCAVHAI